MTIQRAAKIIMAIYYQLLEEGFDPPEAIFLARTLACSPVGIEFLQMHKDRAIEPLVRDLAEAYQALSKKHKILFDEDGVKPDTPEYRERVKSEVVCFLEIALAFNYEPEQSIGY